MPRPPVTVQWANESGDTFLPGNLVCHTVSSTGSISGSIELTPDTTFGVLINGPVGVVTGVPVAGAAPGDTFTAVIEGEAMVRLAPGLSGLAVGQRLYVSPALAGTATNDELHTLPVFVFPIGTIKSLQADPNLVLATMGPLKATDQQNWLKPLFQSPSKGTLAVYLVLGAKGPNGSSPGLATAIANSNYGTNLQPFVLGVSQGQASQSQGTSLVYNGVTELQMEVGLDFSGGAGQQIWLSDTLGGFGTNVKPTTSGSFLVPLGISLDVSNYNSQQLVTILFQPGIIGTVIP